MSLYNELAELAAEADTLLAEPEPVEIDGEEVLAIVQEVPLNSDIEEAGTSETSAIVVVVRKALIDTPAHGMFLVHNEISYVVKNVTTDNVWYTLFCFAP